MKYQTIKVRGELVELLKRCQAPGEPLSDTLKQLLDPVKVFEREKEARGRDQAQKERG